jgi:hypothetical protein
MTTKRVTTKHTISLAEGKKTSWITVTKAGEYYDPRYGDFEITTQMLNEMVNNFNNNTFGQEIYIDRNHWVQDGVAGTVKQLTTEGMRLRAQVEWSDFGIHTIRHLGFKYISAEYTEQFVNNETKEKHGTVLYGAALTPRPVIKGLGEVELSEQNENFCLSAIETNFFKELQMKKLLKKLSEDNHYKKLNESVQSQITTWAESLDEKQDGVEEQVLTMTKALAEQISDKKITIELPEIKPQTKTLSADDVADIVAKQLAEIQTQEDEKTKKLAQSKQDNLDAFKERLTTKLSEENATTLFESNQVMIDGDMTKDKAIALADHIIAQYDQSQANAKLKNLGWTNAGDVHIPDNNQESTLQQHIDKKLAQTNSGYKLHLTTNDKDKKVLSQHPFVNKVLAVFDAENAYDIQAEVKALADGTDLNNTDLPAGFQRTVLREALSDLRILELVATLTDAGATTTTNIPYEVRDGYEGDGAIYEGQGIPSVGISQKMDTAYLEPVKLAMTISNEVMHFTRASQINWDAYARNVESNARIVREIIARKITNEMVRSSDSYNALSISSEDVSSQIDGSVSQVKTAKYPVVIPKQIYSMQGDAIGATQNPITVTLGSATITQYKPGSELAPGKYWKLNSNLGYIMFVDESGNPHTPTASTNCIVSYDYSTNVIVWDRGVPSGTDLKDHLDGLLRAIGERKAHMSGKRFVNPDFMLMSPELNNDATSAKTFTASNTRNGDALNNAGDLDTIKAIPAYATNTPGTALGDTRILIGQRGATTYTIAKPYAMGAPFEKTNDKGRPTGEKISYGEEYSAIHTPRPIANRYTSIIVVDKSTR